jgi:hypothetical protein
MRGGRDVRGLLLFDAAGEVGAEGSLPAALASDAWPLVIPEIEAARQLASIAGDIELSCLVQHGTEATILLAEPVSGWFLTVIFEGVVDPAELLRESAGPIEGLGGLLGGRAPARKESSLDPVGGAAWARDAVSEIDRAFGEDSIFGDEGK